MNYEEWIKKAAAESGRIVNEITMDCAIDEADFVYVRDLRIVVFRDMLSRYPNENI